MADLKVYQAVALPSAAPRALWLRNILEPALTACRFELPCPVELRPTAWGGWCASPSDPSYSSDGRVCITSRAIFWSKRQVIAVTLHELAHRLLDVHEKQGHNAAFFCLLTVLYQRVDDAGAGAGSSQLTLESGLYDVQDLPPPLADTPDRGLGRAISWATQQAAGLAPSRLGAEACGREILARYATWLLKLQAEPEQRAARAAAASERAAASARWHEAREFQFFALRLCLGLVAVLAATEFALLIHLA